MNNYLQGLISKIGCNFRDTLPNQLADMDFATGDVKRFELIIPQNPLKEACYVLLFDENSKKLERSLLFRLTDFPQSFTGLMNYPSINQITNDLRSVYDNQNHKREKVNIEIPQRGGDGWYKISDATYKDSKNIDIYVIKPNGDINLAKKFEDILSNHSVISTLEKEGKKYLEMEIDRTAVEIETLC